MCFLNFLIFTDLDDPQFQFGEGSFWVQRHFVNNTSTLYHNPSLNTKSCICIRKLLNHLGSQECNKKFCKFAEVQVILFEIDCAIFYTKGNRILRYGCRTFDTFLGFSDFFLWSPPWNNENKSCLNDIKFWEVSRKPKTSRFWKLQLSMSSGTQKVSNDRHPYLRILFPFLHLKIG